MCEWVCACSTMSWNASYVYGYDDADADDDYDESPSVDFMEYLRRRASCSVLPDPPPALVLRFSLLSLLS